MTDPRAVRYRRLALAEKDPEKARILLADEAEQGILCVSQQRVKSPAPQATPVLETPRP